MGDFLVCDSFDGGQAVQVTPAFCVYLNFTTIFRVFTHAGFEWMICIRSLTLYHHPRFEIGDILIAALYLNPVGQCSICANQVVSEQLQ